MNLLAASWSRSGLPIAEARSHLDHMVELGILELDSDDHGHLLYTYPMRPPASELPRPAVAPGEDGQCTTG